MGKTSPAIPTTKIISVSIPVSDQERAKQYYCDVLGFDLLVDKELWQGARLIEVGLPGSDVVLLLLDEKGEIPVGVRMGVVDSDAAHRVIKQHDSSVRDEVLRLEFAPPMFEFTDPDGNVLVYIEDPAAGVPES
ncbi:MAG TPA: VOC family protein [Mycobacterium sp.]|jgi:catechol 2,3-dioxygenase-like lactoylglutathione lyase family enzyme|nr:VOC family protein [Mycobacterium sp.]MCB9415797.1 VOC family protein [Mycolicibacterium sp.]MCB0938942.1 VOC family protein [Mycobacterium sp.]TXI41028.1 MAG: VOC family protein [Mycobacterium sp.]HMZ15442.1 VOC family protein [Mycobacterium sp.]